MKKPKINLLVIKEDSGYSATGKWQNRHIFTCGDDIASLKEKAIEAVNLTFEDKGITYDLSEITFHYDVESFFDFYKIINATALSERIGMPQSLLAQYIRGIKKPSANQTKRIVSGVHQIAKELLETSII